MGDMEDRGVEDLASAELAWAEAQATGLERDTVQVMVRDVVVVVVGQEDADLAATDLVEAVGLTAGDLVAMHQEDVGLAPTDPVVVADLVVAGLVVADPAVADPAVADLVVVGPAVVDLVVAVDLVVTVGLVLAVGLVQVVTVGLVVVDLVVAGQVGTGRREVLTSLLQAVLLMLAHPLEDIHTTVMKAPHALVAVEASVEEALAEEALAEVLVGCLEDLVGSEVAEWAAWAAMARAEQGLEAWGRPEEAICR